MFLYLYFICCVVLTLQFKIPSLLIQIQNVFSTQNGGDPHGIRWRPSKGCVENIQVTWSVYELKSRVFIFILNEYEYEQATGISIGSLSEDVGIWTRSFDILPRILQRTFFHHIFCKQTEILGTLLFQYWTFFNKYVFRIYV